MHKPYDAVCTVSAMMWLSSPYLYFYYCCCCYCFHEILPGGVFGASALVRVRQGVGLGHWWGVGDVGASNDPYSGLNLRLHIAMIIAVLFLE